MNKGIKISYVWGIFLLLFGAICILGSLNWTVPKGTSSIQHIGMSLLETLGVAIFGIGILNIILETNGWRNYFEDRLKHIVIDHSYLTSLDDGTLRGIQTGVFKALFGDKSIDREGSFLEYFDSNLHKYIGAPYREDVTTEIFCKSHDENRWKISQRVTYTCRRSAKGIQDDVRWGPGDLGLTKR